MWEMKDWGRAGRWVPRVSLHLDAKDRGSVLHFHSSFCVICSTLRTHVPYEKLYHEVIWPRKNPLGSRCVSPAVCCQSFWKGSGRSGFCGFTMWDAEPPEAPTDVLFVSQLTIVAALSEILGLCALRFRQKHFSSAVLLHWSWPNRSGSRKSTAAM